MSEISSLILFVVFGEDGREIRRSISSQQPIEMVIQRNYFYVPVFLRLSAVAYPAWCGQVYFHGQYRFQ